MNERLTELVFILDRSGSMSGLEKDTIGGFNSMLQQYVQSSDETRVTTVLFDDRYELLWDNIAANEAKLTSKHYFVRGSTAMLDAIGRTVDDVGARLARTPEHQRPSQVIVIITTDGEENCSHRYTYSDVQQRIARQRNDYNWEFVFVGANIDVAKEAEQLGIQSDLVLEYAASEQGVATMYMELNDMVVKAESSRKKFRRPSAPKDVR